MSENIINVYTDDQSALILDETNFNPQDVFYFHNLGEKPITAANPEGNWGAFNTNLQKYQNASFVELHIFDENENFIITLNSGKPLLQQPSTGKFYFGDYHLHRDTYMVGAKHTPYPHETLELVRYNQITPVPYDQFNALDPQTQSKYALKLSQVFEILKNIPNFALQKDTKFIFKYALFGDLLLQSAVKHTMGYTSDDQITDDQGGNIG